MGAMLNDRQELFCKEYIVDLNATQAAIRSGYSESTAHSIGHENLRKPDIELRIQELMQERSSNVQIDANYVLTRLKEIDQMDVLDILEEDMSLKPISKWPKTWRTSLSGVDVMSLASGDTQAIIKKIKWPDKVKNLELLGRHIGVKAFEKETAPVTGFLHIMPVPTAASVEDWEAQAKANQSGDAV